jgi:hypothetical protein
VPSYGSIAEVEVTRVLLTIIIIVAALALVATLFVRVTNLFN